MCENRRPQKKNVSKFKWTGKIKISSQIRTLFPEEIEKLNPFWVKKPSNTGLNPGKDKN